MRPLTDRYFKILVEKSQLPVIVVFGTVGCPPCLSLRATVTRIEPDWGGQVSFFYADIRDTHRAANKYLVKTVPTLILFRGGVPVGSLLGAVSKERIEDLLGVLR
jgi:thioredoxin 1